MFERLRKLFRRTKVETLPLQFEIDENEDGHHVVKVYKQANEDRALVRDIRSLWRYGYREEEETDDGTRVYALSEDDRQTLLSLKSLNPDIRDDGALVFEVSPPILRYLRTKPQITEGESSQRLRVSDEPLRPTAKVEFDRRTGLTVQVGYALDDSGDIIPEDQLHKTTDGGYARLGNTFVRLPDKLSDKARELLQRPTHQVPLSNIPEFFTRDLVLIKKDFNAVLTDLANLILVLDEPLKPVVRVDRGEQGWLDFRVEYQAGALRIPHDLLSQKAGQKYCQVNATTWVANDPQQVDRAAQQLERLDVIRTVNGYRVPVAQFASLEEFIDDIGGRAELSAAYREFLDQLTGFQPSETFPLTDSAEAQLGRQAIQLRPYQRSGIHWLHWLYGTYLHGVLADDMGLGKTLESICALRLAYEQSGSNQHSLVVAPKSVLVHWQRELQRFYPEMLTYKYHGPGRQRFLLHADRPIVFISTYATVANDIDHLMETPFFYLILDEATRIKNPGARRTQAVKALNAAHRLALTGTPVENRPAELWSLFDFLMRGHLGRYGTFTRVFEDAITAGDHHASERLGHRIRPFLLRRKKGDVAQDLPDKIEMDEWCELTEEQKQLYGGLIEASRAVRAALRRGERVNYTASILPVITKLKQICDHPALVISEKQPLRGRSEKFDWVIDKIAEIHQQGEQVVVFSHFLGMLDLLEAAMQQKAIRYIRMDGSTRHRQPLIDRFNQGEARVALCSLMATGHGINLQSANHVIHADRWWNPAIEDQATDRVHRIGQDRTVYVYRILTEGTLEERIDRLLEEKRGMADRIIGAATTGPAGWTREELLELLRPLD